MTSLTTALLRDTMAPVRARVHHMAPLLCRRLLELEPGNAGGLPGDPGAQHRLFEQVLALALTGEGPTPARAGAADGGMRLDARNVEIVRTALCWALEDGYGPTLPRGARTAWQAAFERTLGSLRDSAAPAGGLH